jgi:hypothetical protein
LKGKAVGKALTDMEKKALEDNVRGILKNTIPRSRQTGRWQSVKRQLNLKRFKFIKEIDPELLRELEEALEGSGLCLP